MRADPELIMHAVTPWSNATQPRRSSGSLAAVGCSIVASRYAAAIGARLPLQHYELLRSAMQQIAGARGATRRR